MISLWRRWRCRAAVPLLVDHAEGILGPADEARVERHLRSCARCREELEALRTLPARLREEPDPVPTGSWERQRQDILRAVRLATAAPEPRNGVPGWKVVSAMAAAAVVAAVAGLLLREPTPRGAEMVAVLRDVPDDPRVADEILDLVPGGIAADWQDVEEGAVEDLLGDIPWPLASLLGAESLPDGDESADAADDLDDLDDVVGTWLVS